MCGIVAIVAQQSVAQAIYSALMVLQHRGQDAAGIVTAKQNKFYLHKGQGLVSEVFQQTNMAHLMGHMGIGHVRYPTAGNVNLEEAQPMYVNFPYGIMLAHNGNLTNTSELAKELTANNLRHLNTGSDSEILLNVLAHELHKQVKRQAANDLEPVEQLTVQGIFQGVSQLYQRCVGGYAVVAMLMGLGVLAFRDPAGIRPLVLGQHSSRQGKCYMLASESVALNALGYQFVRDVAPGEVIFIDQQGHITCYQSTSTTPTAHCIFEYVYLARPDSIMDSVSVYQSRIRMGAKLAQKIAREWQLHDIDVVIPIPETANTAALELAQCLKLNYRQGFVKNRYIGRTFIMQGQANRLQSVKHKLNAIPLEFKHKNVLLVDDSIVRGTTSRQIVELAREAGAAKVYLASAAPVVRHPNVYGIDIPSRAELVGHERTVEQIRIQVGADRIIFQDLPDLIAAVRGPAAEHDQDQAQSSGFDVSVFNGEYPIGDINQTYLDQLAHSRSDEQQSK